MSQYLHRRKTSVVQQILLLGLLLTLSNLAAIIHKSSRVYLFQQAQCLTYYITHDPTQIGSHSRIEEALCKLDKVQSRLSITDGIDSFLSYLPGKSQLFSFILLLHAFLMTLRVLRLLKSFYANNYHCLGRQHSSFLLRLRLSYL